MPFGYVEAVLHDMGSRGLGLRLRGAGMVTNILAGWVALLALARSGYQATGLGCIVFEIMIRLCL